MSGEMKGAHVVTFAMNDGISVDRLKDKGIRSTIYMLIGQTPFSKSCWVRNCAKVVAENVVKRKKGMVLVQVVEKTKRINPKACHSCPMQDDIMVI
jgi:hypothetical protein